MIRLMKAKLLAPRAADPTNRPLYFNTLTLARFMRTCYGAAAQSEAQRHIEDYASAGKPEQATIWKRVLAHLRGAELTRDGRWIVRAVRSLKSRKLKTWRRP